MPQWVPRSRFGHILRGCGVCSRARLHPWRVVAAGRSPAWRIARPVHLSPPAAPVIPPAAGSRFFGPLHARAGSWGRRLRAHDCLFGPSAFQGGAPNSALQRTAGVARAVFGSLFFPPSLSLGPLGGYAFWCRGHRSHSGCPLAHPGPAASHPGCPLSRPGSAPSPPGCPLSRTGRALVPPRFTPAHSGIALVHPGGALLYSGCALLHSGCALSRVGRAPIHPDFTLVRSGPVPAA
jgi:hypothetical protein